MGALKCKAVYSSLQGEGVMQKLRVNKIFDVGISCAAHEMLQIYLTYYREQFYIKNIHL